MLGQKLPKGCRVIGDDFSPGPNIVCADQFHGFAFRWKSFALYGPYHIFYAEKQIYFFDSRSQKGKRIKLGQLNPLVQLTIKGEYIYLLFENEVHLYQK